MMPTRLLSALLAGVLSVPLIAMAQTSEETFFEAIPKPGETGPTTLREVSDCHAHWKRWVSISDQAAVYGLPEAYVGAASAVQQQNHWANSVASLLSTEANGSDTQSVLQQADARVAENIQKTEELFGFDQSFPLGRCFAVPPGQMPPGWNTAVSETGRVLMTELTADTVDDVLTAQSGPILLGVAAGWYTQKEAFKDQLRTLARDNPDLDVYYVNDDTLGLRAMKYRLMAYPTILLIENDAVEANITGRKTDADYAAWLASQ
ncbi:MAG: hypothetical protein AAGK66_02970 [Pseudomonadota bacterium]